MFLSAGQASSSLVEGKSSHGSDGSEDENKKQLATGCGHFCLSVYAISIRLLPGPMCMSNDWLDSMPPVAGCGTCPPHREMIFSQ